MQDTQAWEFVKEFDSARSVATLAVSLSMD